ncbi:LOW QUALITY PROTEIN: plexin-C1 [Bufo gargarizans]|uniref:LOW QUALITY PROTEIN: plexin-C1 n=1 Tax=Bufo gargarizans TaxID=30331 RepID=UPI001CF10A92|nr:LOW QUALITY PROTEIN: plexin-C1 [Bufo gargarizans]
MSRIPLSLLFIFMLTDLVYNEEPFHFMYPINNIAVGGKYVIVATENCLYQFTYTLRWLKTTGPQGNNDTICMREEKRDHNTTYNKILLVYNDTVLTCWNRKEGFCRELHIDNLKPAGEIVTGVVPQDPKHPARGFIFFAEQSINLFVATFPNKELKTIILRTKDITGTFIIDNEALSVSLKARAADLNYVDAFQWKNMFIFPYYPSVGGSPRVVVLHVDTTTLIFHTQSNLICGSNPQRKIILSSFAFESSEGLLWAGIFTTNNTASIDRTALCIFNFTVLETRTRTCINEDFEFNYNSYNCRNFSDIMPIHRAPILTHGDLTAVHVKEVEKRLVFFLGTGNGKLLKTQVTLNSNYTANCPEVLYTFTNEAPVFHTIPMDPVDINYLYVATVKEIKRLKIANCEQRESCNDCLSANDPHCGWCPSENRCTMKTECGASTALGKWIGISDGFGKCLKIKAFPKDGKIAVSIEKNPSLFDRNAPWNCEIINKDTRETLCSGKSEAPSLNCSCQLSAQKTYETATLTAAAKSGSTAISAQFQFQKCSQYTEFSCLDCISSGCLWCTKTSKCTSPLSQCENNDYVDENKCILIEENAAQGSSANVTIEFVEVDRVLSVGKKNVLIGGKNCSGYQGSYYLVPAAANLRYWVSRHINSTHAEITLPESQNEVKRLCVDFHGNCYNKSISYESASCAAIVPNNTWLSGGRKLRLSGRNLDLIDGITISKNVILKNRNECLGDSSHCYFIAPKIGESAQTYHVKLAIQESTATCGEIIYKEDPIFIKFVTLNKNDNEIEVIIEKTEDELEIQAHEIEVQIHYIEEVPSWNSCNITAINQKSIHCKARKVSKKKVNSEEIWIEVILGNFKTEIKALNPSTAPYYFIFLVIPLLVIVVIAAIFITRHKSKKLSQKLSKELEELECEIRKEIREGFAELQTDKEVVTVESIGTIPFFDYRHFALNTLFPEGDKTKQDLCEKLCENIPSPFQTIKSTQDEEIVNTLKTLFENQNFLVLLIHTLEKQTDFSIKDRCMFASFLTINFQSNLLYLTGLLERLIKDLIEQSSNKQPKLMLRRTETVVEKLLTNWMSTCLYGFLRESVGEPLYSLVSTLNQRIHRGPIDAVTCKALYTLSEDWLLWQITEFSSVELNVHFPKTSEHEDEDTSQYLKVTVLDCDTIGQVKEKILQSFKINKGYCFEHPLCDIGLELHHGQTFKELSDIDSSNVMMDGNIKKLNTIKHYQIDNGATIKLIVKKNGDLPDMEYSRDHYCHLEMPESGEIELQNHENRGKHKFKVKELYLTKLLSTKVAVHSAVEKLFRSIWTVPHNKPPMAIKYFFDFLDAQVTIKKITDPDVVHIWKTNSLPLRFWINILKNPQFVLDIKKTALLDICLSVIAQAFMDGFSLAEHQLGTSAPTNKLLYAKDIPLFKEEVKAYYKEIRDTPTLSSTELTDFLTSESKKHENEFKEDVAVKELFKYIEKYFDVIISTLEKETGFDSEVKELQKLKKILADKNKCAWE